MDSDSLVHPPLSRSRDRDLSGKRTAKLRFTWHKPVEMADSDSDSDNGDDRKGFTFISSLEEGNRNKRKHLADFSLDIPTDLSSMSLTEFPRYELLEEKFKEAMINLGSLEGSCDPFEEGAKEVFGEAEWDDPIVRELEQLLSHDLGATFRSAIKKIVQCGYTEEVAEWAVLRSGIYCGFKDAESNIVDGALVYLKHEKEFDFLRIHVFEDLHSVASYTMLEMISVLRELRPALSVAEAMWCLLICDSNLSHLCSVEGDPTTAEVILGERSDSALRQSKSDEKNASETIVSNPNKPPIPNLQFGEVDYAPTPKAPLVSEGPIAEKENPVLISVTQTTVVEGKPGGNRKGSSGVSKRDMLRQKTLLFDKNCKGRMAKGAFKAKITSVGSMVLDKKLKSLSDSFGANTKSTSSKTSTAIGANAPPADEDHNLSSNDPSSTPSTLPKKDTVYETKPSPQSQTSTPAASKNLDYYAQIPYDESLGEYVPQDDKDEVMLSLIDQLKSTEKDLHKWNDWANEKVMQAARRLGKDQQELKTLRREKEDDEKFQKDKKISEENTMKRLAEMEYALANASGQIEMANSTAKRLEGENSVLKNEMGAKTLEAVAASENAKEAEFREQEALKSVQAWEPMKSLLQEDVTNMKGRKEGIQQVVEKDKARLKQIEARQKKEEMETARIAKLADSFCTEKEQTIAAARIDDDLSVQETENIIKKTKDDIKKLKTEISEMRQECEASKIAALRKGISFSFGDNPKDSKGTPDLWGYNVPKVPKRLACFRDNFGVRRDRECVMCLTDDRSVLFLPCAHQVVCGKCNVLHEKQGMKDCPTCRATIQRRISAHFFNP